MLTKFMHMKYEKGNTDHGLLFCDEGLLIQNSVSEDGR